MSGSGRPQSKAFPCRSHRLVERGFGLVEMIVAILIAALLVALLMPVVQKGIESARSARCVGNLRQIGLMTETYLGDSNNQYPWAWAGCTWDEALVADTYFGNWSAWTNILAAREAIAKGATPMRCPSRKLSDAKYQQINGKPSWITYGINYVNFKGAGANAEPPIYRAAIRKPSQCIYVTDSSAETGYGEIINSSWADASPSDRHLGSANVLWADGHVTSEKKSWLVDPQNRRFWMIDP